MEQVSQQQGLAPSVPAGALYTWGINKSGCLAIKAEGNQNVPQRVQSNEKFSQVSTGGFFGAAVTQTGYVYSWGETKHSRTGHTTTVSEILLPKRVPNIEQIRTISCGNWHTLALSHELKVFATGHNKYGACGIEDIDEIKGFRQVEASSPVHRISAGDGYSLFLDGSDKIYSCGFRLHHGNASDAHQFQVKPIRELRDIPIRDISAGFVHAACVGKRDGEVYTWGQGDFLQLGHGNSKSLKIPTKIAGLTGIQQVSCTRGEKNGHTMALSVGGEVYTWGNGYKGKLGHDTVWSHEDHGDESRPKKIEGLSGIEEVIAGGVHSALLSRDKKVLTFGCTSDGRLGHPQEGKYIFLYKEPVPKAVKGPFEGNNEVIQVASSYYFMAAIAMN